MVSTQSKEGCSHCRLTKDKLADYLAFYLCCATAGKEGFSRNPGCLAVAALKQMGVTVDKFSDLTENFNQLKGKG